MNKYRKDAEDDDGCENYPINFNKRHERLHIFSAFGLFVCCQLCMFFFTCKISTFGPTFDYGASPKVPKTYSALIHYKRKLHWTKLFSIIINVINIKNISA